MEEKRMAVKAKEEAMHNQSMATEHLRRLETDLMKADSRLHVYLYDIVIECRSAESEGIE